VDARLRELERKVQALESKEEASPFVLAGKEGLGLRSAQGDFVLRFGAHMQADTRTFVDRAPGTGNDTFLMRRVRPILEGTVYDRFDFRLMPDFGSGATQLFDAYVDLRLCPELRLRAGKFKPPLGLEQLQQDVYTAFVERALPAALVPIRDVGVQVHGVIGQGVLAYALGAFNGVPDGTLGDAGLNDSKELDGRLFSQPFASSGIEALRKLGLGVSGSYQRVHGTTASAFLPTFKSAGQQSVFSYRSDGTLAGTSVADGAHGRLSPQGFWYWGRFGLLGEYVRSSQDVRRDTVNARMDNSAWQAAAYWVLTGEDASYTGVKPRANFDPDKGQWGAWELDARFNSLTVDPAAFPVFADPARSVQRARAVGVGINWYMNPAVKAVLDFEQTRFLGGAATGVRKDEKAVQTRLQLAFF